MLMLTAILILVISMVVWCTKKYKTSRNDVNSSSYPEQQLHARQDQVEESADKFTGLRELKGNEAYDCTLNDLIPTKEDVVYDEAILHRENVAYGCIVNQTQETFDMKGNEAYGCTIY